MKILVGYEKTEYMGHIYIKECVYAFVDLKVYGKAGKYLLIA